MKKLFTLIFFISTYILSFSQEINFLNKNEKCNFEYRDNNNQIIFEIRIPYIDLSEVKDDNNSYYKIISKELNDYYGNGEPLLPNYNKIIEIPEDGICEYEITNIKSQDIDLNKRIIPAQNSISNNIFINESSYQNESISQNPEIEITNLGTMRNKHLVRLTIKPFSYNPKKNQLTVFYSIDIKINIKSNQKLVKASQGEIINNKSNTYVIITHQKFKSEIEKFSKWKTIQGYNVKIAYVNKDIDCNKDSIKEYLQNFYYNPPEGYNSPAYVLFAGDETIIPTNEGTQTFATIVVKKTEVTDLAYCEYTNDYLPEIMYGRISAIDIKTMGNIIDKIISYEKCEFENTDYLNKLMFISGNDDGMGYCKKYSNTELKYLTNNYANETNQITPILYPYQENYGEMDCENENCSSSILENINKGIGLLFYSGHGHPTKFDSPQITSEDINNLPENNMPGFWIINCCLTSKYNEENCFSETLLRKKNGGAIGYIGAANNTEWGADFIWLIGSGVQNEISNNYNKSGSGVLDALFHTKENEQNINNQYITAGQIVNKGNLAVTESNIIGYQYYWETINLMGDPSMLVNWKKPSENSFSINPQKLTKGINIIYIKTEPYSLIAISQNDTLITSEFSNKEGNAVLKFDENKIKCGEITIVISAQNKKTIIENIPVLEINKAELNLNKYYFSNQPSIADTTYLSCEIKNISDNKNYIANNIEIELTTENKDVNILNNKITIDKIEPLNYELLKNKFAICFSKTYPQNLEALFNLTIKYNDTIQKIYPINTSVITPSLESKYVKIIDEENKLNIISNPATELSENQYYEYKIITTTATNKNGILDNNENATLIYILKNTGKLNINKIETQLISNCKKLKIQNPNQTINYLSPGEEEELKFEVKLDSNYTNSEIINLELSCIYDGYPLIDINKITINAQIEDFENEEQINNNIITNSFRPWTITDKNPYSGKYCFESSEISNKSTSYFKININNYQDDTIKFCIKTSCEDDNKINGIYHDRLEFSIDNFTIKQWGGLNDWQNISIPLTKGEHTLKWLYYKDDLIKQYEDKVWVDNIIFPPCNYNYQKNNIIEVKNLPYWLNFVDNGDGTAKLYGTAPDKHEIDFINICAKYHNQTVEQNYKITVGTPEKEDYIKIFPTLVSDELHIQIDEYKKFDNLTIYNNLGKKTIEFDINSTNNVFNLSHLKSGIYILKLSGESGIIKQKINIIH
ncbi:MAG: C25 family cysteine peptidase [Bacteroidales bacterium]|nr:C25 family cysteine peptidase [Bacteroidales bacterium]